MWPGVGFNLSQPSRKMESAHRENDSSPSFEPPDPRAVRESGYQRRRHGMYVTCRWERNDRSRGSRDRAAKCTGLGRADQTRLLTRDRDGLCDTAGRRSNLDQLAWVSQTG